MVFISLARAVVVAFCKLNKIFPGFQRRAVQAAARPRVQRGFALQLEVGRGAAGRLRDLPQELLHLQVRKLGPGTRDPGNVALKSHNR